MNRQKRTIPLVLVVLILVGTMTSLVGMMVRAEEKKELILTRYEVKLSSNNQNASKVTKGQSVNLVLHIIDPNIKYAKRGDLGSIYAYLESATSSFNPVSSGSGTLAVVEKEDPTGEELLEYTVTFSNLRFSGSGNMANIRLGYTLKDDASSPYDYSFSVKVSECEEYVEPVPEPAPEPEPEKPVPKTATPYIIISQYGYGGTSVNAGDTFPLTIRFYNTSTSIDIENVVMTVTPPDGLTITSSSNTFYIPKLAKQTYVDKAIQIQARPSAEPEAHAVVIDFKYEYIDQDERQSGTTNEKIAIPVNQPDRFSVDAIDIMPEVYVGEEFPISASFVNKGRTDLFNVSAVITGNIDNDGEVLHIGNLEAGKAGTADFYVVPMMAGELTGEIIITYEDSNMNEKEVRIPFASNAVDLNPPIDDPEIPVGPVEPLPEETESFFSPWTITILAVVLVAAAIVVIIVIKKVRANRSAQENEDI